MAYLVIRHTTPPEVTRHYELQPAAKICEVDRGEIIWRLKRTGRYDREDGKFTVITDKPEEDQEDNG